MSDERWNQDRLARELTRTLQWQMRIQESWERRAKREQAILERQRGGLENIEI